MILQIVGQKDSMDALINFVRLANGIGSLEDPLRSLAWLLGLRKDVLPRKVKGCVLC